MKGIFLYYKDIDINSPTGIEKKVLAQIEAFNEWDLNCSLITALETHTVISKILSRIPFININPTWTYKREFEDVDYIYIRRPPYCTGSFIRLLRKIKQNNPNINLILELPTFPYDTEFTKIYKRYIHLLKDRFNRKKYVHYIDRIVTFSEHKSIWGIKTIRTQNGINLTSIPVRKTNDNQRNVIHIVAVAMFAPWHGYDRLIKGLQLYYARSFSITVMVDFVGEGPALSEYKDLVRQTGTADYVTFHGKKSGKELDQIFNSADIAVASLGIHRIDLKQVSTLKAREYCARGIPFIKAYDDVDFTEDFAYALTIEASDQPININDILLFYRNLVVKYGKKEIISSMREYAERRLSWSFQVRPIVDYIRECKNETL